MCSLTQALMAPDVLAEQALVKIKFKKNAKNHAIFN